MGRKIPGRKHHGVRDPEKQRLERLKKIKDKINAPPDNPEEQQVPKSLQKLVELKDKAKNGEFKRKKRKKKNPALPGGFEQRPGESDRDFLSRVHRAVETVKREAAFEQKYGVEIKRNEQGDVESVSKRAKDPLQLMVKQARREKLAKKKKGKTDTENETRLTKSQKRHLKLMDKKKKKQGEKVDDFEKFQDKVKFGEQVHAPPSLTLPKKAPKTASKPGQKDLLLKSMLASKKTLNKVIDRKGKRKDLPHALRRQLDRQQQEAIQAYRLLKEKKHQQ